MADGYNPSRYSTLGGGEELKLSRSVYSLLLPAMLTLGLALAACEKNNDIVAQEQINDSRVGCPEGCELPPPGCAIKGNISEQGNRCFHVPRGYYYDGIVIQTEQGERWFCTEAEALDNGWIKSFR